MPLSIVSTRLRTGPYSPGHQCYIASRVEGRFCGSFPQEHFFSIPAQTEFLRLRSAFSKRSSDLSILICASNWTLHIN